MPYIKREDQERLAAITNALVSEPPKNPGELNYLFTEVAHRYIELLGMKYQTINDIIGALEGCKLEFFRRLAAPYEAMKIAENGDVMPYGYHSETGSSLETH